MPYNEEQRCLLWLSAAEITSDKVRGLIQAYGSAQGIWDAFGKDQALQWKGKAGVVLERLHSRSAMDKILERLDRLNVQVLFLGQAEYPELLSAIDDPPYALYYAGSLHALRRPMVAVVGTRDPSRYGRDMARAIARDLAEAGCCVVSGLARGIDSCAHEGALKAQGITAAVLGSGINVPYPSENMGMMHGIASSGGIVLSEYPLDAEPANYHFPHRNRVISGLSHALVFVEGKVQSGGMLTVSSALAQGREVFAVPGQVGTVGSQGPHTILREGARLITSAKDVLDDLNLPMEPLGVKQESFLPPSEPIQGEDVRLRSCILAALGKEALSLDQLCAITNQQARILITELSIMEIMGQIRRETGNLFALSR